jgi:hypothetical protein
VRHAQNESTQKDSEGRDFDAVPPEGNFRIRYHNGLSPKKNETQSRNRKLGKSTLPVRAFSIHSTPLLQ